MHQVCSAEQADVIVTSFDKNAGILKVNSTEQNVLALLEQHVGNSRHVREN